MVFNLFLMYYYYNYESIIHPFCTLYRLIITEILNIKIINIL